MGKKAQGQKKGYYEQQKAVTAKHKRNGLAKRATKLAKWIKLGKKKNGQKVLSVTERAERLARRKVLRAEAKEAQRKHRQDEKRAWEAQDMLDRRNLGDRNNRSNRNNRSRPQTQN